MERIVAENQSAARQDHPSLSPGVSSTMGGYFGPVLRSAHFYIMSKIAVIDVGTNSIHMVLAEVRPDFTYKILDRFKDMARLGNGAFETQRLSDEAIARGLSVIGRLATLA